MSLQEEKEEEEKNAISHLNYEDGKWPAKCVSAIWEWEIGFVSLDVIFMQGTIDLCKIKKPGIASVNLDSITTELKFIFILNAPAIAVPFSPVYVGGYAGHTALVMAHRGYNRSSLVLGTG